MLFFHLFFFFIVLKKKILSLDIVDRIFYDVDDLKGIDFSLDYRNREKLATQNIENNNGEQSYGYSHKSVEALLPISAPEKIREYFSESSDKNSCDYFITQENFFSSDKKEKCINNTFCGIIPKNAHISEENKNDKMYCAHINRSHVIVYSVGQPVVVEPHMILQELFFEREKNGIISCHNSVIDIRYINVHTQNGCLQENILSNIMETCNDKRNCEINFSEIDKENSCLTAHSFYVNIHYECKPRCNIKKEDETCFINDQNSDQTTCKYGYNKLQLEDEICQKNNACLNETCSVNEYCDITERTCKCRNPELESLSNKCESENLCEMLSCPDGATCERASDGKQAECKCENDKIFYNNKCYTVEELELAIQLEPNKKNTIYQDHLHEGSALDSKQIFMKCENDYSIEVVNAYITCYKVQFSNNKMKYITELLKKECNGKMKCVYGNDIDKVEDTNIFNICDNSNTIFKYQYLCKANNQKDSHKNKEKVEIFRSRYNSKLQCQGGKITLKKALLKTGEGCDDLDLTTPLESYCNGVSDCDIGLAYQFDTYCINDQYLFVSYTCSDLCVNCIENSSCYGNQFKSECFCDKPYISKNNKSICEKPSNCDSANCGTKQVCKETDNKMFCECENGYKNVGGSCVENDECDLVCPSNKVCSMVDGEKRCKCSNGFIFKDGKCSCPNDYITVDGNKCVPKDKCKRKEYEQICTNKNEECVYNSDSDIIKCECKQHYIKNERGECIPKDYCLEYTCGRNEVCKMVNFTPQCECKENFKRKSQGVCVHENFCLQNKGGCPEDSTCIYNEDGIHECRCNKNGYVAIEGSCVLEDKCNSHNMCSENAICINLINKNPLCVCMFNYSKKDGECVLENRCLKDNGGCSRNSVCSIRNNEVHCECKENYKNEDGICVPKTSEEDQHFTFNHNEDASIVLGSCGILEFNYIINQLIWKINSTNESYVFNYEYPTSGNLNAQIKNQGGNSIVFLKKSDGNNIIFDEFQLDHDDCIYEYLFFYRTRENAEKSV
ncbi:Rh5 interacting protein, putative [Plasmodium gallinaceum]|uniref:RH5 interacting protein n=1 Tax=Plasmodium gallinaceum TaxID=5849 RepID=A0A0K1SBY5_PLAGA|nr:Rh5 interacting protein, putative [Plasmodium gallinaceum]AKV72190.1 RH5 interacting protein [Plasmodium gallinaceum]CRG94225.1 Rh5 interacting protein, putative [Plasmodium gallinaceum]